jgi:hypothetical protein
VDHQFEVPRYLELAEQLGMRIEAVIFTHVRADHRSGDRELDRYCEANEIDAPFCNPWCPKIRTPSAGGISSPTMSLNFFSGNRLVARLQF